MAQPEIKVSEVSPLAILEPSFVTFGYAQALMLPTLDGTDTLHIILIDDVHETTTPHNFPAGLPLRTIRLDARKMRGDFTIGRQESDLTIIHDPTVSRRQLAINYDPKIRKFTLRKLGGSKDVILRPIPPPAFLTEQSAQGNDDKARWRQIAVSPSDKLQISIGNPTDMSSNPQHRVILSIDDQGRLKEIARETSDAPDSLRSRRPQSVAENVILIGNETITPSQDPKITYISLVQENGIYRPAVLSEQDINNRIDLAGSNGAPALTNWVAVVTFMGTHFVYDNFKSPSPPVSYTRVTPWDDRTEHYPLY